FDGGSSDDADEFGDGDGSDPEFRTALSAPKPKSAASRPPKRGSGGTSVASPEQAQSNRQGWGRGSIRGVGGTEMYGKVGASDGREAHEMLTRKPSVKRSSRAFEKSAVLSTARSTVMRKAAMIQNSIVTHQGRPRSPSLTDVRDPPFPIPTRAS